MVEDKLSKKVGLWQRRKEKQAYADVWKPNLTQLADNVQGRVVADFVDGQARGDKVAQSSHVPPSSLQAHMPACVRACVRLRRVRVCVYV